MKLNLAFLGLLIFVIAVEVLNYVGKDLLAAYFEEDKLSASMEKAKGDLKEADKRLASRRSKLDQLGDDIHKAREELRDLDDEGKKKRIVKPVLIHTAG